MRFHETIQSPEVTHEEPSMIYKIISSFNRVELVFQAGEKDEKIIPLIKTYPLGENDPVYFSLKKHFQLEPDFFIVENVPYKELPASTIVNGARVGMMFLSKTVRMGGYGIILKQVEKLLTNKGNRLAGKGALLISFPKPLATVNRRRRFRLQPRVEETFCEISGYVVKRDAPIPTFPVRNLTEFGASILMLNVPSEHIPEVGDTLFIRLSLFTAAKGYGLKRGVVVSVEEIVAGNVTQQQYVFQCRVAHIQKPNERTTELGLEFVAQAREGLHVEPKSFPRLTYIPLDPAKGIETIQSWCMHIQQIRRSEEKERGL